MLGYYKSLDNDGDLTNGIVINTAARGVLIVGMTEVDNIINQLANTTTATIDIDNLINNIIEPADTAGTYTVVTAASATAHVLATASCAYSGGFRGTAIDGTLDASNNFTAATGESAETDSIGVLINNDGTVQFVEGESGSTSIMDVGTVTFSLADDPELESGLFGGTLTFTLDTVDSLSGFLKINDEAERITASRIGGSIDAIYRATGAFSGDDIGLYTFDVAAESVRRFHCNRACSNRYSL